jgi:hypothetical protein
MERKSPQGPWLLHQTISDVVQAEIASAKSGPCLSPANHILGITGGDAPRSAVAIAGPARRCTGAPSTDLRLVHRGL